ncbi:MAG TPA: hypothetical protein VF589_08750 [Allosphingosinicella sp.]|jgi:hypothetical protein
MELAIAVVIFMVGLGLWFWAISLLTKLHGLALAITGVIVTIVTLAITIALVRQGEEHIYAALAFMLSGIAALAIITLSCAKAGSTEERE